MHLPAFPEIDLTMGIIPDLLIPLLFLIGVVGITLYYLTEKTRASAPVEGVSAGVALAATAGSGAAVAVAAGEAGNAAEVPTAVVAEPPVETPADPVPAVPSAATAAGAPQARAKASAAVKASTVLRIFGSFPLPPPPGLPVANRVESGDSIAKAAMPASPISAAGQTQHGWRLRARTGGPLCASRSALIAALQQVVAARNAIRPGMTGPDAERADGTGLAITAGSGSGLTRSAPGASTTS